MTNSIGRTRGRTVRRSPRGSLATLKFGAPAIRPALSSDLYALPGSQTPGSGRTISLTSTRGSRRLRQRKSIQDFELESADEEAWRAPARALLQAIQLRFSQGLTDFVIMLRPSADFQDLTGTQLLLLSERQTAERVVLQCGRKLRKKGIKPTFNLVTDADKRVVGVACQLPVDALKPGVCQALDTLREEAKSVLATEEVVADLATALEHVA